jgi:hypothetical protein
MGNPRLSALIQTLVSNVMVAVFSLGTRLAERG